MVEPIDTAMILSAGLGTRLRPITDTCPKPLVTVGGKALIDHVLDRLSEAGIDRAVVNVHHLADMMIAHLSRRARPKVVVSDERDALLDSGGGVVRALPMIGAAPFLVLNADSFWLDPPEAPGLTLRRMKERFDGETMDLLMLLARPEQSTGFEREGGDFVMDGESRLSRIGSRAVTDPLIYAGVFACNPRVFAAAPQGPFSLNRIFDEAMNRGRLFGLVLEGEWLTVGTPEAVVAADAVLRTPAGGSG